MRAGQASEGWGMRLAQQIGVLLVLLSALWAADMVTATESQRDLIPMPKVAAGTVPIDGEYWALIIGIDKYRHVPKLQSAVRDAQAVREVLVQRYGFTRDRIIEIINDQATREGIENALYQLRKKAGKDDSVFIYYAGHGQIDQEDQIGYWVPMEGKPQSPGTFISNARVRDEIARMKAKHVYLVADSCFAGTLFAAARTLPPLTDKFFQRLYANKSRWGLTSGQNEPVTDRGKDGHSMFAYFFLKLLGENEDPYLVPSHIYDEIAPLIGRNTEQQPRSEPLQNAGDEGGQFVFRLTAASGGSLPGGPAPGKPVPVPGGPSAALSQAEQEHKKIEEARARPYEGPQQAGKEITGKDGAPMLLIPAGEFLYGEDNQRLSLPAFYMDKYEVTTKLYAAFMQATGRAAPKRWNEASQVSDGDRPVIGVDWNDAEAYCRQYGKRLPTEQEWEKAARGTDGREYPWGNEEPTSRHANFGKSTWDGYATLTAVGEHEAGKSPYGIYDMAGNVWEWTSSDYDSSRKVRRGGSWYDVPLLLQSANRYSFYNPSRPHDFIGFRCAKTP